MLTFIFILAFVVFLLAFRFYGRFLEKQFDVDDKRPTPSHAEYDGVDRVPAHPAVLFGHHFSSIAGAGPIVGPVIAVLAFGWLPTIIWIVLGTILVGGVLDFSSLMASLRHHARSIAEIARTTMSPRAFKLLLSFSWLTLVYVLTVFADLAADTFVADSGVASSSFIFIGLAFGFGFFVYRLKVSILKASLIFVPLVFLGIWIGQLLPLDVAALMKSTGISVKQTWALVLFLYCFVASILPVWLLLQPRDYLSSFLLYSSLLMGFLGVIFGGFSLQYPAFTGWYSDSVGYLFPALFVIVACGACSGFHALVASGTSSKQLDKESHARPVGYGAMLVEGLLAVIALITVAMLSSQDPLVKQQPLAIYAGGMARFCSVIGIPSGLGYAFGLLALSTFILTTLDTATRLGRYIFEEFFHLRRASSRFISTAATLLLPMIFMSLDLKDAAGNSVPAWKAIWPVFGATNQLLAGLALLVIMVWLKQTGKKIWFILWPMVFMIFITVWSLIQLVIRHRWSPISGIAAVLLVLAFLLIVEVIRFFTKGSSSASG